MPNRDCTGPDGRGPRRRTPGIFGGFFRGGRGYDDYSYPQNAGYGMGRGQGRGAGRGAGRGRGQGGVRGKGMGNGRGRKGRGRGGNW